MALKNKRVFVNSSYLRARRLYLGKSQEEVAEAVGVSQVAISRFENGYLQPSMKRLVKLARVYECDVKSFMTETARVIWSHLETLVLEHAMAQSEEMEEGNIPNMDLEQFTRLSERLGVFAEVEEVETEQTEAEGQMAGEIR